MSNKARVLVASLTLSAAAFIGLVGSEGYTDGAIIPTKGDVPTIGFGSTVYPDGSRVKMGDRINPVRAIYIAGQHIAKDENRFRESLPGVSLYQYEYDTYLDFVYQYGMGTWNGSSMRRHLLNGNYRQACDALLLYRFAGGFDCSTPGNRRCMGVWTRQQERHAQCIGG